MKVTSRTEPTWHGNDIFFIEQSPFCVSHSPYPHSLFIHLFISLNQLSVLELLSWELTEGEFKFRYLISTLSKLRHLEQCLAHGEYLVHVNNFISFTLNIWRIKSAYSIYFSAFSTLPSNANHELSTIYPP